MAITCVQTPQTLNYPLLVIKGPYPSLSCGRLSRERHVPLNRCRLHLGMGLFESSQGHEKGGPGEALVCGATCQCNGVGALATERALQDGDTPRSTRLLDRLVLAPADEPNYEGAARCADQGEGRVAGADGVCATHRAVSTRLSRSIPPSRATMSATMPQVDRYDGFNSMSLSVLPWRYASWRSLAPDPRF